MNDLRVQDFERHVGERFSIVGPDARRWHASLIEASEARSQPDPDDDRRRGFALVFRIEEGERGPEHQGIYSIEHDALDTLHTIELFLVPIGPDGVGMCLHAVFA